MAESPEIEPVDLLKGWEPISFRPPYLELRIKLHDGSELEVWQQSDGDFWCEQLKIFIDSSNVSHWKKSNIHD